MVRRLCGAVLFVFAAAGGAAGLAQEHDSVSARVTMLFLHGYALLPESTAQALGVFEEIVRLDSINVLAQRQLGSLYITAGRPEDALQHFVAADRLLPSDTTRLQIAYLLSLLNRHAKAYRTFSGLTKSNDPAIRATADPAAVVSGLMACDENYPWWFRIEGFPYIDTRFHNLVVPLAFRAGWYTDNSRITSLTLTGAVITDTRSQGGALPVFYSDNYFLAACGIRLRPFRGLTGDIQGGVACDLLEHPGHTRVREDFRAILTYGKGIYPPITLPHALTFPLSLLAEIYGSFGYYSRYSNGIGYGQGKMGSRVLTYRTSALDVYVTVAASVDTRRDFFNNIVERGAGVSVLPHTPWGLRLTAEFLRGTYWSNNQSDNPYGKTYTSVRIFLLFDRFLCL